MATTFTREDFLQVLANSRLFSRYAVEQLVKLISYSKEETFTSGEIIIQQDQENDKVFILLSGVLQVSSEGEYILRLRRKGDLVGEISFLTKNVASATVTAYTDAVLFSISAEQIEASNQSDLKDLLQQVFLDILTQKLSLTTNMVKGFQVASEELIIKKQELAKSEGDLYQKEAILRQVLSSMSDGVVVTDGNGITVHVNEAFKGLVGKVNIPDDIRRWPETLGLFKPDEITPFDSTDLLRFTRRSGSIGESSEIYLKNDIIPDGIWLQASGNSLGQLSDQQTIGSVIVFRDFSKTKAEEKALIKARDEAVNVAKMKSSFLSVMSHELRTPLNGIIGMVDLLTVSPADAHQKECINSIKVNSENLLRLVQNILDYSNLESNTVRIEHHQFNVHQYVEEVRARYQPLAENKGLTFNIRIDSRIPNQFSAYQTGIHQIITNLMDNAIKFTDHGKIVLSFSLLSKKADHVDIVVSVEDTGIGIRQKDMNGLFEPFNQVDGSLSRRFDGSGIGLSICKKYAQLMGSDIWVESQVGSGSTFYFSIKKVNTPDTTDLKEVPADVKVPVDNAFAKSHPLNILVAEDNPFNQILIKKILTSLGYDPKLVSNGRDAVEYCRNHACNVVFMDLHMPEMDGVEASSLITQDKTLQSEVTVIALTASVSDDTKRQCFEAGMKDYLSKPIKRDQLAEVLRKCSTAGTGSK